MSEIGKYTKLQKQLHKDIQKLITSKKYIKLNADETLVVFGRIYSVYALAHLKEVNIIEFIKH